MLDYFKLTRTFFDFSFENPDKIKPNHIALYMFCVEHCNRLGWKTKFGLPTTMAKDAIGIRSYNTYIKTLDDLIEYGFIQLIEKSKNQYSSNIIALSKYDKALDKALDKAFIKHGTKHSESTVQSIDSIIKQMYNKQYTNIQLKKLYKSVGEYLKVGSIEKKEQNFIDKIVDLFKKVYEDNFELPYVITNKGKEKGCAGKILKIYKDKYPESNSDETLKGLEAYFNACCRINDNWLSQNMSLSIIINKFNEINKILKNGKNTGKSGATIGELAEMLTDKFGISREE